MTDTSRRSTLLGAGGLAATTLFGAREAAAKYDPSQSISLTPEDLAKYKNPALLKHMYSAKPLVNKERAYAIMDKYGLDGLVATVPRNVYYLSSHDNAFYHTGIDNMMFALLPRNENAPPALIIWGALLYHLDYRPTWMQSVQVYTAPLQAERVMAEREGSLTPEQMQGDPPAINYNRNLVRKGAKFSDRDRYQLALAAEYVDKTSASAVHALKRALVAAGLTKGKIGFDDPRAIPWMKDVGLLNLTGVDAADIFKEVRMVKSATEIALIRECSRKCEAALDAAIASLHVGQSIAEVEGAYRKKMGEQGGNTLWLIINQDGLNSGRIERDKVIKIDSVGEYLGYVGDIGRSIVVGTPTDETARRNEANTKALKTAYAAIRPGTTFAEAARIGADVMRQEGFNGYATPHNVGMEHTDQPSSMANPLKKLEPLSFADGTVFTLDMPYLEIGYGSSHVEDMMVVGKTGVQAISSTDTSLRIRPA
jgi:Xaa-Pro aminopeptidase